MVNDWKEGNKILALTFEFGVKATRETLANTDLSHFRSPTVDKRYVSYIPIFAIELEFSEYMNDLTKDCLLYCKNSTIDSPHEVIWENDFIENQTMLDL